MTDYMRQFVYFTLVLAITLPLAATAETTITYQGQLQESGQPFTGTVDEMTFELFDDETGGNSVGGPLTRNNVAVTDGLFQVELDFGANALEGTPRYLQASIDGSDLQPRQRLTATPTAVHALNAPGDSEPFIETLAPDHDDTDIAPGRIWLRLDRPGGEVWSSTPGDEILSIHELDRTVYAATAGGDVLAYDGMDGGFVWEHDHHDGTVNSVVVHDAIFGLVWSGGADDKVIGALPTNGDFGAEHTHHESTVRSVHVGDGVVYSGANDGKVIAAEISAGLQKSWEHDHHTGFVLSVHYDDGVVYSGGSDNAVIAANADTDGTFIWDHDHHNGDVLDVFARDEVVYSAGNDGSVIAARADNGNLIWASSYHSSLVSSVFERNGILYASGGGAPDNTVVAADAKTGTLLWRHDLHVTGTPVHSVFESRGLVYSGGDGQRLKAATTLPAMHMSDGDQWQHIAWIGGPVAGN